MRCAKTAEQKWSWESCRQVLLKSSVTGIGQSGGDPQPSKSFCLLLPEWSKKWHLKVWDCCVVINVVVPTQTEWHSLQCSCWRTPPVWRFYLPGFLLVKSHFLFTKYCLLLCFWECRRRKTTMHSMFVNMDVSCLNWDSTPKIKDLEIVPLENPAGHIGLYSWWKDTLPSCKNAMHFSVH